MDKRRRQSDFADKTRRRQTIDFTKGLHKQITIHGKKRGCRCFGESVRDIIRLWFDSQKKQEKNTEESKAENDNL